MYRYRVVFLSLFLYFNLALSEIENNTGLRKIPRFLLNGPEIMCTHNDLYKNEEQFNKVNIKGAEL